MEPESVGIPGTRVVVVEDEALIAEELRDRLGRLGAVVLAMVSSAEAALDAVRRHQPDLLLLDIRIKGECDGIAVADRVRAFANPAIVFLTAHADAGTLDRAKRVNPTGYLLKPIDDTLLRLVLELALYRHVVGQRLLHAQKLEAVGRIAGGVAHDINNLMTIVTGFSEVLLAAMPDGEPRRKLEKIRRAGERSAHLTRQLLGFSRQLTLAPRLCDLAVRARELADEIRGMVAAGVEIELDVPASTCTAFVDPAQLRTVLVSIVDNAVRAMPLGGRLTIAVGEELLPPDCSEVMVDALASAHYARVSIADTGIGMPPPVRASVFEPFFRPRPFDRTTGISLAAAYGVVRQSGGTIRVFSETGRGTRIDVLLPQSSDS